MTDKTNKFPKDLRTFETRLLFIKELFENKFDNIDIMAHCIAHKLDWSYLQYCEQLRRCAYQVTGEDPLEVLKGIK